MDKNKPTAGRTKAIHRRLELSFNLYLLLLFVGQNRASKSLLHITPRISRFLQSFQQIKLLKDNSSRQNPLIIVGSLGWPYYISSPFFLYRRNVLLPNSLIVCAIGTVILRTAHMVPRPVVAGHPPDSLAAPSACTAPIQRSPRRPLLTTASVQTPQF